MTTVITESQGGDMTPLSPDTASSVSGYAVHMRQRISHAVNSRFPRLSWDLWGARRTLSQYSPAEVLPALRNRRERWLQPPITPLQAEPRLLLIVPASDHVEIPWEPAQGNYSFELAATANSCVGAGRVSTLRIDPSESTAGYHTRIVNHLNDGGFTHVIGRIDVEANGGEHWSWDLFTRTLRRSWPGMFLPLTYDSAYPYISMHLDRITRLHHRAVPIVLDRPIIGVIRPHRPAAGPLFLPLSDESTMTIEHELIGVDPEFDLTFIGNVTGYPYRKDMLADLAAEGLEVTVNPQGRSSTDMPGFISYARALRQSRVTLNFTRCNGVPVTQLKTRMLEGSLFGSIVASDSPMYARDYFREGEEFLSYSSPRDLKAQLETLLGDPDRITAMRERARARADVLRVRNFWEATDRALRSRALPPLLPEEP